MYAAGPKDDMEQHEFAHMAHIKRKIQETVATLKRLERHLQETRKIRHIVVKREKKQRGPSGHHPIDSYPITLRISEGRHPRSVHELKSMREFITHMVLKPLLEAGLTKDTYVRLETSAYIISMTFAGSLGNCCYSSSPEHSHRKRSARSPRLSSEAKSSKRCHTGFVRSTRSVVPNV